MKDDLLNRDVRIFRYTDAWDVQLVFDYIASHPHNAVVAATAKMELQRDNLIAITRIILACRSSDLAGKKPSQGVFRETCVRRSYDEAGLLKEVGVRFRNPKQRGTLPVNAGGYTSWIDVAVVDPPATAAEATAPVPCFASMLCDYIDTTEHLPRPDDRLFISSRCYKPGGPPNKPPGYRGIGPEALAKVMGRVMGRAGVPADFLPHSARHAGVNYRREQGWTDEDIMEMANMSARTYVTHYMRKIRRSRLDNADSG